MIWTQTLVHAILQLQLQEYKVEKFIYIFLVPYILSSSICYWPLSANILQRWNFCSYPLTGNSTQNIKKQNSSSSPYSTLSLLSEDTFTCNTTVSQIKLWILPDKELKLVDSLSPAMGTELGRQFCVSQSELSKAMPWPLLPVVGQCYVNDLPYSTANREG